MVNDSHATHRLFARQNRNICNPSKLVTISKTDFARVIFPTMVTIPKGIIFGPSVMFVLLCMYFVTAYTRIELVLEFDIVTMC